MSWERRRKRRRRGRRRRKRVAEQTELKKAGREE